VSGSDGLTIAIYRFCYTKINKIPMQHVYVYNIVLPEHNSVNQVFSVLTL